jgi:serine/threonine protein kinase
MTLVTGSKLGPYEIVARLGAGGMGEVYRARDMRLGRDVAVKTGSQGAPQAIGNAVGSCKVIRRLKR